MFYKNTSYATKTFYGVEFKPGETKEVNGFINDANMIRVNELPKEPPVSSKIKSTTVADAAVSGGSGSNAVTKEKEKGSTSSTSKSSPNAAVKTPSETTTTTDTEVKSSNEPLDTTKTDKDEGGKPNG